MKGSQLQWWNVPNDKSQVSWIHVIISNMLFEFFPYGVFTLTVLSSCSCLFFPYLCSFQSFCVLWGFFMSFLIYPKWRWRKRVVEEKKQWSGTEKEKWSDQLLAWIIAMVNHEPSFVLLPWCKGRAHRFGGGLFFFSTSFSKSKAEFSMCFSIMLVNMAGTPSLQDLLYNSLLLKKKIV